MLKAALCLLLTAYCLLLIASPALAQTNGGGTINFSPPAGIIPTTSLKSIIQNVVTFVYSLAGLMLVGMFVYAGVTWIRSGGDKGVIESAQKRITSAVIGMVIMALAFVIIRVAGQITGIDALHITIPSLSTKGKVTTTGGSAGISQNGTLNFNGALALPIERATFTVINPDGSNGPTFNLDTSGGKATVDLTSQFKQQNPILGKVSIYYLGQPNPQESEVKIFYQP